MKIAQLNLTDIKGGAAIAAYRLHKGLRQIGQDSYMLVRKKLSTDQDVFQVEAGETASQRVKALFWRKFLQDQYIDANRSELSNSMFTLTYPGYDLAKSKIIREADIIDMHWISYFQSIVSLKKLLRTGKPVVWTLHDQWAFTGGCHYAAGCDGYITGCATCPQLRDDPFHLPRAVLQDKIDYFRGAGLTIVTPSRWLARCAEKSNLFKNLRIEVIPNSIETGYFYPISKKEAKKKAGVPEDSLTLLFVAEVNSEKRKGFKELLEAIRFCMKDPRFKQMQQKKRVHILCMGEPSAELDGAGIPLIPLGYLKSEEKIRNAYNAADLYILPSLEDNLPNTMLEAMACGTPVVSFAVGGMPDMIENGKTGALAENLSPEKLGEAILGLLFDPEKRERLGKNCRELIEQKYALHHQAENYLTLYKDLLEQNRVSRSVQVSVTSTTGAGAGKSGADAVNAAAFDGGLSPKVKKVFAKVLKKGIAAAVPDNKASGKLIKTLTKLATTITPVALMMLLYRLMPGGLKEIWQKKNSE